MSESAFETQNKPVTPGPCSVNLKMPSRELRAKLPDYKFLVRKTALGTHAPVTAQPMPDETGSISGETKNAACRKCDRPVCRALVPSNIAEGFGYYKPKQCAAACELPIASLTETKSHLQDGAGQNYFDPNQAGQLIRLTCRTLRASKRLLRYLATRARAMRRSLGGFRTGAQTSRRPTSP